MSVYVGLRLRKGRQTAEGTLTDYSRRGLKCVRNFPHNGKFSHLPTLRWSGRKKMKTSEDQRYLQRLLVVVLEFLKLMSEILS